MPHISEMKKSLFLKKEDVGDGALVTIKAVQEQNVAKEGAEEDMKWCLILVESEKPLVLNSTNAEIISHITGSEETDGWTGKKIVLYNDPTVSYKGKVTGGIRVRAPKNASAPVAQPKFGVAADDGMPF